MNTDACAAPTLLPIDSALQRMAEQVTAVTDQEWQPLQHALDRILAQAIHAPLSVPPQDNSAMDGYALRAGGTGPLHILGTALAGHPFTDAVTPGTCVRIMTGAPIPEGADAVVMQENTQRDCDTLTLTQAVKAGENIRRRGEDLHEGSEVLPKGKRLGPVDIALLASLGIAQVAVYRRLTVAILSTGDELIPPGQPLAHGQIYDSNRYGIAALLQRLNVEVLDLGLIPDQPDAIRQALAAASTRADAVISSGGVSVGDADFVKAILNDLGEVHFWKVAIKPGKPFAFGTLGNSRFFGLPGNPVSAMITLHQLTLPILRRMAGEHVPAALTLTATAANDYHKRPGRCDYQRAQLSLSAEGQLLAHNTGAQGSGILSSFSRANAYAVLEQERGRVSTGETVTALPFDRFLV